MFFHPPNSQFVDPCTCQDLAAIIKSDKVANKDYCIIDVRDDDWSGGNIKGAMNSPSYGFLTNVDQLVKETKNIPLVVFHCALSQARGPKAARVRTFPPSELLHRSISGSRCRSMQKPAYFYRVTVKTLLTK